MARRKFRLFPVALSPAAAAECLGAPVRLIHASIYRTKTLEAFVVGNRVRIPVDTLFTWVRSWPRADKKNCRPRRGEICCGLRTPRTRTRDFYRGQT